MSGKTKTIQQSISGDVLNDLIKQAELIKKEAITVKELKKMLRSAVRNKEARKIRTYDPPKLLKERMKSFQLLESIMEDVKTTSIFIVNGRTTRWFTDYKTPAYRETILSLNSYGEYVRLPRLFTLIDESLERQVGYNPRNAALAYTSKYETVIYGPMYKMIPVIDNQSNIHQVKRSFFGLQSLLGKKQYVPKESEEKKPLFRQKGQLHLNEFIPEGPDKPAYFFQYSYYPPVEKQMRQFYGVSFTLVTTKETFEKVMELLQHHTKKFPFLIRNLVSNDVPDRKMIAPLDDAAPILGFSLATLRDHFDNKGKIYVDAGKEEAEMVVKKYG